MPTLPGKQCRVNGCSGITTDGNNGYCPKHKNHGWAKYQTENPNRIYQTARWKRVRGFVIRRDKGLCQHHLNGQVFVAGTECDHIKPLSLGGDPYDPENIQLLCKECHKRKTAKE